MATKLYASEMRSTGLPPAALEALGGSGSRNQGYLYVTASSKAAAYELILAAGCSTSKSALELIGKGSAPGRDLDVIREAGFFEEPGVVIAMPSQGRGVARFEGAHGWQPLGEVTSGGDFVSGELLQTLEAAIADVATCRERFAPDHDLYRSYTLVLDAARARLDSLRKAQKGSAW